MATINSLTFDEAAYNPGDLVSLTVDYTPDTPSVVPQTFTATATITNAAGTVVANSAAPFVVNEAQAAGDQVGATDDGNRTWTRASDTGSVAVLTATA
jgi:hypothetical protein